MNKNNGKEGQNMEQFIMKTKIYMGEACLLQLNSLGIRRLILYVTRLWKNQEGLLR